MAEIDTSRPAKTPVTQPGESSAGLIDCALLRFEPGYWRGLRQPSVLVGLRLTRLEIAASALQGFDHILTTVWPSHASDNAHALLGAHVSGHPILGRLLHMTLCALRQMGMPVMGGATALRHQPRDPSRWLVGLPAVSQTNRAPLVAFGLSFGLMNDLAAGRAVSVDDVRAHLQKLVDRFGTTAPAGVNTLPFLQAAHDMGIPWCHVANNIYQFGWGRRSRWLDSSFTDETSAVSASLARDKVACAQVLRMAGLPVPRHQLVASADQAVEVAHALRYPVVVKPANLDGGRGVMAGLRDAQSVRSAFDAAAKLSKRTLVEQFVPGQDYRVRICRGQVIGVVIRKPASVVGDGASTVRALIDRTNEGRKKHTTPLDLKTEQGAKPITVDAEVQQWLEAQSLHMDSILAVGQQVRLRGAANVSLGGTTWDVTDEAHPDNLTLALQAAAALRLDVAGVDLLLPDIAQSWRATGGAICEVNAQPQFSSGDAHRSVLGLLIQGQGRIPVVAITGLDASDETAREVVQHLRQSGVHVSWATTSDECRQALRRKDVDGVVWQMNQPPAPDMAPPVDRFSLWIDSTPVDTPQMRDFIGPADAIWKPDGPVDPHRLAERLIDCVWAPQITTHG